MGRKTDIAPEAMETHRGVSARDSHAQYEQLNRRNRANNLSGVCIILTIFSLAYVHYLGNHIGRGCLAVWGKSAPMPKRIAKKPDRHCSGGHSISQSQEPLPPYELDPVFNDLVIRNRIAGRGRNSHRRGKAAPVLGVVPPPRDEK